MIIEFNHVSQYSNIKYKYIRWYITSYLIIYAMYKDFIATVIHIHIKKKNSFFKLLNWTIDEHQYCR